MPECALCPETNRLSHETVVNSETDEMKQVYLCGPCRTEIRRKYGTTTIPTEKTDETGTRGGN